MVCMVYVSLNVRIIPPLWETDLVLKVEGRKTTAKLVRIFPRGIGIIKVLPNNQRFRHEAVALVGPSFTDNASGL